MGKRITQDDLYAARIFFNSALPLLRVVIESRRELSSAFRGKSFVFQVSALYPRAPGGKMATHFVVENGRFTVKVDAVHPSPTLSWNFRISINSSCSSPGGGCPSPGCGAF